MNKHTHGPWKVFRKEHKHYLIGNHVEFRIGTEWIHGQLKDHYPVVTMSTGVPAEKGGKPIDFVGMREEDAYLIAAAPQLHEGLEAAILFIKSIGQGSHLAEELQEILDKCIPQPASEPCV